MPNSERVRKLVKALRSGRFMQGTRKLRGKDLDRDDYYCCLGVACEVAMENGLPLSTRIIGADFGKSIFSYSDPLDQSDYSWRVLPRTVQTWYEFSETDPLVNLEWWQSSTLAHLNDDGFSFTEIADIIERNFISMDKSDMSETDQSSNTADDPSVTT